jgi:hypothetical protein
MKVRIGKGEAYLNVRRLFKKTASYSRRDSEVALVLARKTTEAICKFVYYTHVSDKPNSLTLENLLAAFSKDRIIPKKILTPMRTVQSYGNFGAHDQEDEYEDIDETYALPCLSALETIMKWFQSINTDIEWALTTNIYDVGLSKRTVEILRKAKLISLAQVCTKVENELLKVRGLGMKTLFEIKEVLTIHGLSLGMKFDSHLVNELSNIRINSD